MKVYFRDTCAWINKLVWNKDKNRIQWNLEYGSEYRDSMKAGHDILSNY
jgi:hypothetical protein